MAGGQSSWPYQYDSRYLHCQLWLTNARQDGVQCCSEWTLRLSLVSWSYPLSCREWYISRIDGVVLMQPGALAWTKQEAQKNWPTYKQMSDSLVRCSRSRADNKQIVSTLQAGCFAGAIIAATMADKMGRRLTLIVASIIVLVGVCFQFNAWGKLAPLYIGRFINGFGVGICS